MTVSAAYDLKLIVTETPALALDLAANPDIIHQITGFAGTLNASTSVTAAAVISDTITLTAGAHTIDLTAFTRTTLAAVDFTGTKVKLYKISTAAANTAVVTFATGAANGYALFGTAGTVILGPGECVYGYRAAQAATVSSTVKNIDVSSSDTDAIFSIVLVA